ncbi:DNA polymerase III subunit beta [Blattabacterium sp. (Nauphoeta cinerea)]|uniref:DNA polymerase III subunit beta n=1 Tax=Blattabacterium sp. (Nauphoeta cinerea) TaxID=1316444 RepID=UPI0003B0CEAF|nr:DNA polymerase III subunit beta [Blattabacterium sp. (Nauphoeta cinerea)]AGW85831.1 DNA polymerase III subunit beta [Blattabacterium sp. (Nauphoeta cinerea)]
MYFSISSSSLLRKLHTLYKIININDLSSSITLVISKKNQLKIIWGLNSKNVIHTYVKINVKKYTKEKVIISIKFMIDVLITFSNEKLVIKKKENTLNIYSKQGIYEIPTYNDSNYTNIVCQSSFFARIYLSSNYFLKILNKTLFATGNEELEPILNGVFFQFLTNEGIFVATDTYKLVKYTIKNFKTNKSVQFIISKKCLNIIQNILNDEIKSNIIIEYRNKNNIVFYFKNHIFLCQPINEKYPNYHSVIPPHNKCHASLIFNKLLLLNTIKRISIFSRKKENFIDFHFNHQKLKICNQININNSVSEIECQVIFNNLKNIKIGFNSQFLIEILSSLNEDFVYFEFYSKMGVIKPLYKKKKKNLFLY